MENKKRCYNCRWFATEDSGYSNYTVMDTVVHCLKGLNPAFPCNESYSWRTEHLSTKDHEILRVAETCPSFEFVSNEKQIQLDVDGEISLKQWADDDELYQLALKEFGTHRE